MAFELSTIHLQNLHTNNKTMFKALQQPCADCNVIWHPLVMSFDHVIRKDKFKNPSNLRTYDPVVFNAELDKCEVVCLNCHQMREYLRDLGVVEISERKVNRYKYYHKLVPYLSGGAMLRKDAYAHVPIGVI